MGIGSNEDRNRSPSMNPEIRVTVTSESDARIHIEDGSEPEQATVSTENNQNVHLDHSFSEGNFHHMISDSLQNPSRRSSLPPGILEHGAVNNLCGKILRFMGDEHFSKTCGKHLRCMGDEMCYTYLLRNMIPVPSRIPENVHHISNSQSLPDLTHFSSDEPK